MVSTSLIEECGYRYGGVFRANDGLDRAAGGRPINREGMREGAFTYVFELEEDEIGLPVFERSDTNERLVQKV